MVGWLFGPRSEARLKKKQICADQHVRLCAASAIAIHVAIGGRRETCGVFFMTLEAPMHAHATLDVLLTVIWNG